MYGKMPNWPLVLLKSCCLAGFLIQMAFSISWQIFPQHTVARTEQMSLTNTEFPVLFKVCIKPSFDNGALVEVGYRSVYEYFCGASQYNPSHIGWAGHTRAGDIGAGVRNITLVTMATFLGN